MDDEENDENLSFLLSFFLHHSFLVDFLRVLVSPFSFFHSWNSSKNPGILDTLVSKGVSLIEFWYVSNESRDLWKWRIPWKRRIPWKEWERRFYFRYHKIPIVFQWALIGYFFYPKNWISEILPSVSGSVSCIKSMIHSMKVSARLLGRETGREIRRENWKERERENWRERGREKVNQSEKVIDLHPEFVGNKYWLMIATLLSCCLALIFTHWERERERESEWEKRCDYVSWHWQFLLFISFILTFTFINFLFLSSLFSFLPPTLFLSLFLFLFSQFFASFSLTVDKTIKVIIQVQLISHLRVSVTNRKKRKRKNPILDTN